MNNKTMRFPNKYTDLNWSPTSSQLFDTTCMYVVKNTIPREHKPSYKARK